MQQRRQPGHVFIPDLKAVRAQLGQSRFHVARVPKHNHVEHQAERAELVFLAFAVVLAQFATFSVLLHLRPQLQRDALSHRCDPGLHPLVCGLPTELPAHRRNDGRARRVGPPFVDHSAI